MKTNRLFKLPVKAVALALALLVVLTGVVACGKQTISPTATPRAAQPGATPTPLPTSTPAPAAVIKMKVQSMGATDYPSRVMLENIIKMLESRSNGRIKVDYYPAEGLVKTAQAFDAVRENVLQIGVTAPSYAVDRMGIVGDINWMPWNWDFEKFAAHYRDPGGFYDFVEPYYEKWGLRMLSHQAVPGMEWFSRKDIKKLEDFKGVLYRDAGGAADWIKALGLTPVAVARSDFYEAMQRGTVDAGYQSLSGYVTEKWYDVSPYLIMTEFFTGGMVLVMNNDFYNSLPADLKQIVDKAVLDAEQAHWQYSRDALNRDLATVKAVPKAKIYQVPPDELARWRKALEPYYNGYATKYGDEWQKFQKIREKLLP